MDHTDTIAFNAAVKLFQSGNKEKAYLELKTLYDANSNNINLLLWLAFTAPTLGEAEKYILIASEIEPINFSVKKAQEWLNQQKISNQPSIPIPPPPVFELRNT